MPDPINWSLAGPYYAAAFTLAYFVGSIPFGLLLVKFAGLGDIRRLGSGNIGATNVLRTGRKSLAVLTLLLDGGKGVAATLVASSYGPDITVIAGLGAVLGHLFPVWLRFKGGKGVATALGAMLGISWLAGALACGVWLGVAALFRYSSLASLAAMASMPLFAWLYPGPQFAEWAGLIAMLVAWRHAANIKRLVGGTESRISFGRPDEPGQKS
jgi:glycerol-3-phosphate acyltransferase PlsY